MCLQLQFRHHGELSDANNTADDLRQQLGEAEAVLEEVRQDRDGVAALLALTRSRLVEELRAGAMIQLALDTLQARQKPVDTELEALTADNMMVDAHIPHIHGAGG